MTGFTAPHHARRIACWTVVLASAASLAAAALAGGVTASLESAVRNNDSEAIERALRESDNVGFTAPDGKTILMAAAADDNLALVDHLLARAVDVGRENDRGGTALMYAAANGSVSVARRLLDAGARIDHRAENGWTALTLGAAKGHLQLVDLLLDAGADPNVPDVFGFTALMRAAQNHQTGVVARLAAEPRTDANRVNVRGLDALDVAMASGYCDVVKLLDKSPSGADSTACLEQSR